MGNLLQREDDGREGMCCITANRESQEIDAFHQCSTKRQFRRINKATQTDEDLNVLSRFIQDQTGQDTEKDNQTLKELHIKLQNDYASQRSTSRDRLILGKEHQFASLPSTSNLGSPNQHESIHKGNKASSTKYQITEATETGDLERVKSLLQKTPAEQITSVSADVVESAVRHEDYEMLRALLQHYQNLLKSNTKGTSLDNQYNCLIECVHKDNPLMTKIIVDAIVDVVRDSREILFEELLVASIKRCCNKSVIRDISRLWKSSFAIPNDDDSLAAAYISILKTIRNDLDQNDDIYFYSLFSLNLLRMNTISGNVLLEQLPKGKIEKVLEHKAKHFLDIDSNRPYLNFLLSPSENLDNFLDWHIAYYSPQTMKMDDALKMITATLQNEEDDEVEQIRNYVDEFVKNLCIEIHRIEPVLQCTANRVGSAQEKTRVFHPNEFDYEIVFQELPKLFKLLKCENSIFFRLTTSPDFVSKIQRSWLFEFNHDWYLDPDALKDTLNDIIQKILYESKSNLRDPFRISDVDIKLCSSGNLCIEPFGNFIEKFKFSCINIFYFGDTESKRKDLPISIDLIPALECDLELSLPPHNLLESLCDQSHQKTHVIAYGAPLGFQLGFSMFENQVISALPQNLKDGYKLAKGVRRILTLCHEEKTELDCLQNEHKEGIIPTYMLKTAVLVMTQEGLDQKDSLLAPIEFTCKIYKLLLQFLEKDKRIPNFFLNPSNSETGECVFQIETHRKLLRERECLEMIAVVKEILNALEKNQVQKGGLAKLATAVNIIEEKRVTLKESPVSLRLIKKQLWCCCHDSFIGVFDLALNHVRDMRFPNMCSVCSAVDVGDRAVVAAKKGLFVVSYAGKLMKTISGGFFADICYHAGCVYAAPYGDPAIHVYDQNTWNRISTITACKSNGSHGIHTLRVTSSGITLACYLNHCIHVLDRNGTLQQTHGKRGYVAGEFFRPYLCSVESDGSVLVADEGNRRYQIFHDGVWRVVPLQPWLSQPRGAVVTEQVLFVSSYGDKELIMYNVK